MAQSLGSKPSICTYTALDQVMQSYLTKVQELLKKFEKVQLKRLLIRENNHANVKNIASEVSSEWIQPLLNSSQIEVFPSKDRQ